MAKKITLSLIGVCFSIISFGQLTPEITSWKLNLTGATGYGGILSDVQSVKYSANNVYISCTDIPSYSIGPWPGNPNVASNQGFVYKITRNPVQNTGTATAVGLGHIGVWSNGVSIFNVYDAQSYNNQGIWNRNAYYWEGASFDACHGHPQMVGEYHHHVSPTCLYDEADSTHHSPIIGYAFDGFPIYGAYGYANANGTGGIKRMAPSYALRNMTTRDTLPDGTVLTSGQYGPAISSSYPLGCYIEDYKYTASSGDLDARNGRFCVTPEYPLGTYAYFVTIDNSLKAVFPYTFYGTYYGVVQCCNSGPGTAHNTITETVVTYDPTGISEHQDHRFFISPNPTTGITYLNFNNTGEIKATLYDARGGLVKSFENINGTVYELDFSRYSQGLYFLLIETSSQHYIQKIEKN